MAATMPAAVLRDGGRLAVEQRPVPDLGPADVLIEVAACGICGTDLHLVLDGWGEPGIVPGHEYAGHVAAVGAAVDAVEVGAAVTANPQPGCGECRHCARGRPSLCPELDLMGGSWQGGFAQFVRVDAGQVVPVPDGLGVREAALAEPLAVALHAIGRGGIDATDRVLVTGAGPLGLLAVAALRARGVEDVRVSEPVAARRERAAALGADAVAPDELTDAVLPFQVLDDAVDVVLECSGVPAAARTGIANLDAGGRLVVVGSGLDPIALDGTRVMVLELEVTGAVNYDQGGLADAVNLLAAGTLPVEDLLAPETVGLGELQGAMQELAEGRIDRKLLVSPAS